MQCAHCGRPGRKLFKGYCSKSHRLLDRKKKHAKLRLQCKNCGTLVIRNPSQVSKSGNVFCKKCKKNSGELHHKWKEGQYITPEGYRVILKDGSYLPQHRVVWQETNKATLLSTGMVHHVNYDKLDNSPDNLLLFSSEEHGRFHRLVDAGRREEARDLLRHAADRQHHFPENVASFIRDDLKC